MSEKIIQIILFVISLAVGLAISSTLTFVPAEEPQIVMVVVTATPRNTSIPLATITSMTTPEATHTRQATLTSHGIITLTKNVTPTHTSVIILPTHTPVPTDEPTDELPTSTNAPLPSDTLQPIPTNTFEPTEEAKPTHPIHPTHPPTPEPPNTPKPPKPSAVNEQNMSMPLLIIFIIVMYAVPKLISHSLKGE